MSKLVEIRMTKTTLYLFESELVDLLKARPDIWERGIRRGKWEKRKRRWAGDVSGRSD
jgi:hypothetical protein